MNSNDFNTIERCPHDAENPYAQISRDLIRDESISPNCRWLLIYLLSMNNGWKVSAKQIYNHAKEFIGRNKVYEILDEAIEAGYIKKEINKIGNLNQGCKYYVSERPKFKKCFRHPEIGEAIGGQAADHEALRKNNSSSSEEDKEEHKKEKSASPPPSADAEDLYNFFLKKIKERNPEFKDPNKSKWIKDFDHIIKIDQRSLVEIMLIIAWASEHSFWKANCLSPASLRKNYDQMKMQKIVDDEKIRCEQNKKFISRVQHKYPDNLKNLKVYQKHICNDYSGKDVSLYLEEEEFREKFLGIFNGKYVPREWE